MLAASLPFLLLGILPTVLLMLIVTIPARADSEQYGEPASDASWIVMANVNWSMGPGGAVAVQANPGDVEIVLDPDDASRRALKVTIARHENFSNVANGAPRAEVLMREPATFSQGFDYLLSWSTYIPGDFTFDSEQMVIITQIHQSLKEGGPTVALTLLGENYYISTRGGMQVQKTTARAEICCADRDKGRWVRWLLRYVPDDSGKHSLTQLWKDGNSVFLSEHVANAYPGDQDAYLKIGLYKAGWGRELSEVETITMLYGPVSIRRR